MNPGMVGVVGMLIASVGSNAERAENGAARKWASAHFAEGGTPALSLEIDGKPAELLGAGWSTASSRRNLAGGRSEYTVTYDQKATGLRVKGVATLYGDCPAVRWVCTVSNDGKDPTPILSRIQALDAAFALSADAKAVLHRSLGDSNSANSFAPVDDPLKPGADVILSAVGGKSSNSMLPFFNLELGGRGVAIGLGWSGQWEARFSRLSPDKVNVAAGQQLSERFQIIQAFVHHEMEQTRRQPQGGDAVPADGSANFRERGRPRRQQHHPAAVE